jgi:hypothetical protein
MTLLNLNSVLNDQNVFVDNFQYKLNQLSIKILHIDEVINNTLIVSQKIEHNQNYMPIVYLCGTFLILISVFFIHTTFFSEKIKNLSSNFLDVSKECKDVDVHIIKSMNHDVSTSLDSLNAQVAQLIKTPGVSDAVTLNIINRTRFVNPHYAIDGIPTVPWESLAEERLNRFTLGRYPNISRTLLFENDLFPIDPLIANDTLSPEMIANIIMFGDMI